MHPSAWVMIESCDALPNSGTARSPSSRTCTTSSRPACDATLRSSTARRPCRARGSVMPPASRSTGPPTSRITTSADTGFPGRPITGRPSTSASSVGFPGLSASP
jgi:hypothetical protein